MQTDRTSLWRRKGEPAIDLSGDTRFAAVDVAIVGDGFAACSAMRAFARSGPAGSRIALICGGDGPGAGLAYATENDSHWLNVRADRMGLDDAAPTGFVDWLTRQGKQVDPAAFLPRGLFGAYLRSGWDEAMGAAAEAGLEVLALRGPAARISVAPEGRHALVHAASGEIAAASVLVCEGPASPHPMAPDRGRWIGRPWPSGLSRLDDAAGQVVIIGGGLSAVDAVLTASANPRVTGIVAVSLEGMWPQPHSDCPAPASSLPALPPCALTAPSRLVRAVRRIGASAGDWRTGVDAARLALNAAWRDWPADRRRRVWQTLGPVWAAHRHRCPPGTLARLMALEADGRLRRLSMRVRDARVDDDCVEIHGEAADRLVLLRADWGVDARGFARVDSTAPGVCGEGLRTGLFRVSDLGFGIAADASHRAATAGRAGVHVVGAARLGDLVETTGAPEVRRQVAEAVEAILSGLSR